MCKILAVFIMLPIIVMAAEWQSLNGPPTGMAEDMSMGWHSGMQAWVTYSADAMYKLYKSINEGAYWDSILDPNIINPTCVITEPANAQVLYAGVVDPIHSQLPYNVIFKSIDAGQTWDRVSDDHVTNWMPICFAMHPEYPDTVYAGFNWDGGAQCLFKTTDGGVRWTDCNLSYSVRDIYIHPDNPDILYAATNFSVRKSTDGGSSWTELNTPPSSNGVYCVAIVPEQNALFISIVEQNEPYNGSIYKTTNDGADWTRIFMSPASPSYDLEILPTGLEIEENTAGQIMYATYRPLGFYKSTDYGVNWIECNAGIGDKHLYSLIQHPSTSGCLFVGGCMAVYKITDYGTSWAEITKGMRLVATDKITAKNNIVYGAERFTIGWPPMPITALVKSENAGLDWQCAHHANLHNVRDIEIAPSNTNIIYTSYQQDIYVGSYIFKTSDGGSTWNLALYHGNCDIKDLTVSTTNSDNARACGYPFVFGHPFVHRTTDGGINWETYTFSFQGYLYTIENDPLNSNIIYTGGFWAMPPPLGNNGPVLKKSTDGGVNWNDAVGGIMGYVKEIAIDPINSQNLFAVSDFGPFRSTDGGQLWVRRKSGLTDYYGTDIIVDPEEPAIIYTLEQHDVTSTTNLFHGSVDGTAKWFEFTLAPGQNPPSYFTDITIDNARTDRIYAGTPKGVYAFYPQYINKHLTSSSPEATSANQAKHMLCGLSDIWLTYESGGVIYAVHSSDGGATWSRKMEIGQGYNPAIASNPGYDPPLPCIVWWAQGTRDTLYFSRHVMDYSWTAPYPLVTTNNNYSPPSFIVGDDDIGRIVYAQRAFDDRIYYTQFNINNPNPVTDPIYFTGINPSIGYMPSHAGNPEIHLVWEQNGNIRYRSRTLGGTWSSQETVFSSGCAHPSIAVDGAAVYFVSKRSGTVSYCYALYTQNGNHGWSRRHDFATDFPLDYPVLTGGNALSCVADLSHGNTEIYFYYNPGLNWIGPNNMSNSGQRSFYPHIVHRQTIFGTVVHFIWTENDDPAYDVKFANQSIGGYDSGEDLAFYAAQGGDTLASPFNLKRTGFRHYGSEPYKRVDYDDQYLEYEFSCLDPGKDYALTAHFYQQGYSNLPLSLKIDNMLIKGITLVPDTLITYKAMVPYSFYADSMVNIRIFGNKAVTSAFVLHRYEKSEGEGGGPQSNSSGSLCPDILTMCVYPNPIRNEFVIRYMLPRETEVTLSVFDVTGGLVRHLAQTHQPAGSYETAFDNKSAAQGVYFIRLDTGDASVVMKTIFLK